MKKTILDALLKALAGTMIIVFMLPAFAFAQKDDKEQKKQEKEAKNNEKDEKRLDKTIRKYEESLVKARKKYDEDDDFQADVDFEYRKLQRDHARLAFDVNTTDKSDWVETSSGEKIPRNSDTLYDNLLAQDYVNRVGQSLVPASSDKRYGFKITVSPWPEARSLSTGTVYVSTGLLSLVDNEAQLAYILGHEIGHIESDHWREDVLVAKWTEANAKSNERKASIFGAIAGGVAGGLLGGAGNAGMMAMMGAGIGNFVAKLVDRKNVEWSLAQEDQADKLAMGYMLNRNYDVRETQTFFETLKAVAIEDPRIELNRFGDRKRAEERRQSMGSLIKSVDASKLSATLLGASYRGKALSMDRNLTVVINRVAKNQEKMAEEMRTKVANGELMAGDGEFENIMSTIKRDNGVSAFYYDMYKLSERNLSQSLAIRSDDALGYFYYGKVLKLTARKSGEKETALQMFSKAIELDKRNANPQARLYYALTKMGGRTTNNIQEIVTDLKQYVAQYQQLHGGQVPPNLNVIYDYMQEAGESNWNAFEVVNVNNVQVGANPEIKKP